MLPMIISLVFSMPCIFTNSPSHIGEVISTFITEAFMLVSMYVIRPPCELHCLPCEKHVKPSSCSNDKSEFSLSHVSSRQIAWKCTFCCLAISIS